MESTMNRKDWFFLHEMKTQCEFAVLAFEDLELPGFSAGLGRFWFSIQSFLVAVGNISKILWPSDGRYAERGERLRLLLGITDASPIQCRSFRNYFEHFDERLEKWFAIPHPRDIVDRNIGPIRTLGGLDAKHFLRNYAFDVHALFFQGERYDLVPVCEEVKTLLSKASALLNAPFSSGM